VAAPRALPPSPPRYASLDVWRGVACLTVVAGHAAGLLGGRPAAADASPVERIVRGVLALGWVGVPLFFVISGYCIAAAARAARERGDRPGEFFRRRFRRILPPYWCCVALTAAAAMLLSAADPALVSDPRHEGVLPTEIGPLHWLGNLTLTETWLGHLTGEPFRWRDMVVAPAWTLCYEEQFYAVVGLLAWAAGPRLGSALVALTAALLVRGMLHPEAINSGFFFDGRWLFFAAGLAVWFDAASASWRTRLLTRGYLLLGLVWSLRDPGVFLVRTHGVEHEWLASFLFAWVILLLHPFDARLSALPLLRPLAACGTRCYSIYLVHWAVVKPVSLALERAGWVSWEATLLGTVPACLAASVAAGWLFHAWVERRFLNGPATAAGAPRPPAALPLPTYRRAG
jgi:peptidoglycan/LPS O-acetylase OafA/YrhL